MFLRKALARFLSALVEPFKQVFLKEALESWKRGWSISVDFIKKRWIRKHVIGSFRSNP